MNDKDIDSRGLFLLGCTMALMRNCFLNLVMAILLIAGIWIRPCLYAGLVILAINIVIALVIKAKLKKALKGGYYSATDAKHFKAFGFGFNANQAENDEKRKDQNSFEGEFRDITDEDKND